MWAARGVKIDGTLRVKCEHCATAHAIQVVLRRVSENCALRLFWRISWDFFDFLRGLEGSQWLLVIKDEYSGMLYFILLRYKSKEEVFPTFREFISLVKIQYGLLVCKIRLD